MAVKVQLGASVLELVEGDITSQSVDAIVNAANAQLAGGGGVDGAIHTAGGPDIMTECRRIGGCPTGEAVMTGAGRLKAKKVIHAVGPRWRDGKSGEPAQLASAYRNAFVLAEQNGLKTVAVPSISTGAYGYPMQDAARVAIGTALEFLAVHPRVELIRFVLSDAKGFAAYRQQLEEQAPTQRLPTLR